MSQEFEEVARGASGVKLYSGEVVGEYELVAASQSNQVLGTAGAAGDYLTRLVLVVTTAATATVSIKDGTDTAMQVFPNSPGGGIGTYVLHIGIRSRVGAWQVTTGAGVAVIAIGKFTT